MADEVADGFDGWLVVLIPAESDPIVAASSQPAHMTTIWFGEAEDSLSKLRDQVLAQVSGYALELDGPVVVPVKERGTLGDDDADVVFLEGTDSLLALRDGLMEEGSPVRQAHDATEQYPEWTPHVTLGYPEEPARAEYDGDAVTFDRIGVWIGDEHHDFVMGGEMSEKTTTSDDLSALRARVASFDMASVVADVEPEELLDEEMPLDELEEGEELVTEVPVHGVATLEGKPTGDGRGFRAGALSFGRLPAPLGYEFESGHGSNNSRVAVVGRIDEFWTVPSPTEGEGVFEVRWRGVIMPGKEYGAKALESIIDGSYDGVSVIIDDVTMDVSEEREAMRQQILREQEGGGSIDEMDVEELLDMTVGDGSTEVRWISAARIRRFDMVPTGAFMEGYTALGHEFAEELTEEQLVASAAALEDCGCLDGIEDWATVDLSVFTEEELAHYDSLPMDEQVEYAAEHGAILASAATFREVSAEERKKLAEEGKALPDGSFPIETIDDLRNAIQAIGRAKDPAAARAHIKKRARELGEEGLIPEDWSIRVLSLDELDAAGAENAYADAFTDAGGQVTGTGTPVVLSFAPGTKDGPGWITHPIPTARIRRYWVRGAGAAKIGWGAPGDFNRCRAQLAKYVQNPEWLAGLCANMHKEALGVWPGQEGGGRGRHALVASAQPAPLFTLVAAAEPIDAAFFKRRQLDNPRVGLVVDGDAVYGYIAQWNVCHVGNPEGASVCTMAPRSPSNYGQFRTGTVMTTEGPVAVGQITMNTGHADVYSPARAAAAHYDNTGAAVADIACGEDNFGIWFAGRIRPNVSEEDRFALAASGRLSGDWRPFGQARELIAALVVNVPGFPIPDVAIAASAATGLTAILAAGIIRPEEIDEPVESPAEAMSAEVVAGIAMAAAEQVFHLQRRQEIIDRVAPARAAFNALALAGARAKLTKMEI